MLRVAFALLLLLSPGPRGDEPPAQPQSVGTALAIEPPVAATGGAAEGTALGARFPTAATSPVPVSDETAAFLDGFDADRDGALDVGEALAFYAAVEDAVGYRYDDERVKDPVRAYPVGDGRPGRDHAQTPDETLAEGLGDCEDTAILEAAFFHRFGVPAVLGFVNLTKVGGYDHAVLLVPAPGPVEDLAAELPRLRAYDLPAVGETPAGAWIVVDHANGDAWGTVSSRARPTAYTLFELRDPDLGRIVRFAPEERPRLGAAAR